MVIGKAVPQLRGEELKRVKKTWVDARPECMAAAETVEEKTLELEELELVPNADVGAWMQQLVQKRDEKTRAENALKDAQRAAGEEFDRQVSG
jgi:hypothetical protein